MFLSFDHEACGVLAPHPGIKLVPPALKGLLHFVKVRQIYLWKGKFQIVLWTWRFKLASVLTTGPPGKAWMTTANVFLFGCFYVCGYT